MKLFIWNRANHATQNWHHEGGIIVVADTLERARELIAAECGEESASDYPGENHTCSAITTDPDIIRECEGPEFIVVHPDAGCC